MSMKRKREVMPQLSAFAARKQAAAAAIAAAELEAQQSLASQASVEGTPSDEASPLDVSEAEETDLNSFAVLGPTIKDHGSAVHQSRSDLVAEAERTAASSVNLDKSDDGIILGLEADTRVTIHGHCNLQVLKGSIEYYGARLAASERCYPISIPKGVSCPVMITTSRTILQQEYFSSPIVSLVRFTRCDDGLLQALDHYPITKACFSSLTMNQRDTDVPVSFTSPEVSGYILPHAWTNLINSTSSLSSDEGATISCIALTGGKGAGKSTLAKHLLNYALTDNSSQSNMKVERGVYYLDLDPGQPELSVPGTTSVYFLHPDDPFTPSFSSPAFHRTREPIRRHWIGETSPKEDPGHYLATSQDLIQTIIQHHSQCTSINDKNDDHVVAKSLVIVNTPGWIKGTGAELLQSILTTLKHSFAELETIFLGTEKSGEEFQSIIDSSSQNLPLRVLPGASHSGTSTATDNRTINLLSYFHRVMGTRWRGPRVTNESWTIPYIHVPIFIMRDIIDPQDLISAINGTIVALVAVDADIFDAYSTQTSLDGLVVVNNHGQVLDPSTSRCLGLAIVHGLNLRNRTVSLITPVELDTFNVDAEASERLVLCTGSIEVPLPIMTEGYTEGKERPYLTNQPGQGVGWQSWHVRRNIGRRVRNG